MPKSSLRKKHGPGSLGNVDSKMAIADNKRDANTCNHPCDAGLIASPLIIDFLPLSFNKIAQSSSSFQR